MGRRNQRTAGRFQVEAMEPIRAPSGVSGGEPGDRMLRDRMPPVHVVPLGGRVGGGGDFALIPFSVRSGGGGNF